MWSAIGALSSAAAGAVLASISSSVSIVGTYGAGIAGSVGAQALGEPHGAAASGSVQSLTVATKIWIAGVSTAASAFPITPSHPANENGVSANGAAGSVVLFIILPTPASVEISDAARAHAGIGDAAAIGIVIVDESAVIASIADAALDMALLSNGDEWECFINDAAVVSTILRDASAYRVLIADLTVANISVADARRWTCSIFDSSDMNAVTDDAPEIVNVRDAA